jgi:Type VI secretion system/phage-baseplate injector OB domain
VESTSAMQETFDFMEGRFFGKYRGLVKDNNDPTGRGRLEVLVPAVMATQPVWALPCVPYAGDNMGFYTIPEVNSGVWVEFEAGDPSYPIWVGCYWGDGQAPKSKAGADPTPPLKILRSQSGLIVALDDSAQVISVSDSNGNNLITVDAIGGQINVKGTFKVVVDAAQIELVEDAQHPIVFGDILLKYLNEIVTLFATHTHPPPTLTPVPVLPPATPDLISFRVRSG